MYKYIITVDIRLAIQNLTLESCWRTEILVVVVVVARSSGSSGCSGCSSSSSRGHSGHSYTRACCSLSGATVVFYTGVLLHSKIIRIEDHSPKWIKSIGVLSYYIRA